MRIGVDAYRYHRLVGGVHQALPDEPGLPVCVEVAQLGCGEADGRALVRQGRAGWPRGVRGRFALDTSNGG